MATAQQQEFRSPQEYVQAMAQSDPQTALQIAMEETKRVQALAAKANEEYRAMAELEFDNDGRITKANMAGLWRLARIYADSDTVPEHYRGKPANCFIACQLAFRWRSDVMMVMQSTYIVHGKPGIEAKLAAALLNTSGKIKGRVRYRLEGEGKQRKCTAFATDAETGDVVEATVPWSMVEAEKWNEDKKSRTGYVQVSKWNTMPDVMFQYRSVTFLVRLFYPEVLMGMRTVDEIEDIERAQPRVTSKLPETVEDLMAGATEAAKPVGTVSHTGPMPSDAELAEADMQQGQQEAEPEPKEPQGWRSEPLPDGLLAKLESAITAEQVEAARALGLEAAASNEQFDSVHIACDGRLAELQQSKQQAASKGKKGQRSLVE